jgi:hypothetical protein
MPTDDRLLVILREHCLVSGVDVLPRGHARAGTKLTYLDGSGVDVFLEGGRLRTESGSVLSDLGQTFAKLAEYGVRPSDRTEMIREATTSLRVRLEDDKLTMALSDPGQLQQAVIDLAQACVRVSCLAFTRRAVQKRVFAHRVRAAIADTGLDYVKRFRFNGPFGKEVTVDYRVTRHHQVNAAILALGKSPSQASKVFCKWSDLRKAGVPDLRVTVFDDTGTQDHPEDIRRLRDVSEVVGVSDEEGIWQLLRGAA